MKIRDVLVPENNYEILLIEYRDKILYSRIITKILTLNIMTLLL